MSLTVRQAERIAAYDWSMVCALGKDVIETGDIINTRYSKWIFTVWQEMPVEIRRQVLMAHLGNTPTQALETVFENFRRWYINADMCARAIEVYCLDVAML